MAIKITKARVSKSANRELSLYQHLANSTSLSTNSGYFASLMDSFQIRGPNGLHTAFVFEPLGPHLWDVLDATPDFHHGSLFENDDFFRNIPKYRRFSKNLGKRILRNMLQGVKHLHDHHIVHGDLHMSNVLDTTRSLECNYSTITELKQNPEDGEPLKRLDGKKDLWAPSYQLTPAGLLKYSSTEFDPYVKIAEFGGGEYLIPSSFILNRR